MSDIETRCFRPTLVGSEDTLTIDNGQVAARFRPTLVGSEVQPLRTQGRHRRFRPTLVGSEVTHITVILGLLLFQTNPRGVGGVSRDSLLSRDWFQTNPRGVGGTSLMI